MRLEMLSDRVIKTADTDADRARLAREARILRRSAHPGVVALAAPPPGGPSPDQLVLRRVDGCRLAELGPQVIEVVAGWGAALATTIADLHELGCFHRRIDADQVLLDRDGRPLLAGFGSAVAVGDPVEQRILARADTSALAALVLERLPKTADRRLVRALRRARTGGRGAPGARTLARLLVERVPGARLGAEEAPGGTAPAGGRASRPPARGWSAGRRDPRVVAGVSAVAVVAAGLIGVVSLIGAAGLSGGAGRLRHPPAGEGRGAGVTLVVGAPPGVTGRFEVTVYGAERPQVAVGRWGCGAPLAVVLDSRTGIVWLLPSWPAPGRSVEGTQLARVPGATSLMARPDGSACDQLVALRDGTPVVIAAGVGR